MSLYGSGLSRKATAARVGVHRVVVDDVLRRAGVEFRDRRKLPPLNEWADRYVDGGETTAEIAATYAASPEAVLRALKLAGIERRRATAADAAAERRRRRRVLRRRTTVARRHREPARSVAPAGARRGRPVGGAADAVRPVNSRPETVRPALRRRRHDRRAWRGVRASPNTRSVWRSATFELPRRLPVTHVRCTISDRQLAALVAAGHSDTDIAARYDVAVWAVVRRRRQEPSAAPPPNKVRPPLSRARLERQLAAGDSRADIATAHHVGLATVTRWCAHYGLDVVGRRRRRRSTASSSTRRSCAACTSTSSGRRGRSATTSASTPAIVTFALHSHRIPVRRGGNGAQARRRRAARRALRRPRRRRRPRAPSASRSAGGPGGWRAASRVRRRSTLASSTSCTGTLGLSTTHISLLTGHSASNVCEVLRHHGIPTRPSSRSPWYERTFL